MGTEADSADMMEEMLADRAALAQYERDERMETDRATETIVALQAAVAGQTNIIFKQNQILQETANHMVEISRSALEAMADAAQSNLELKELRRQYAVLYRETHDGQEPDATGY